MTIISDLYTKLMEHIFPFLQQHWQLFLLAVGALWLLGAIFNWNWVCNPQGVNPQSFTLFVYRNFGEKAHRVVLGISAVLLMLCSVVFWILM